MTFDNRSRNHSGWATTSINFPSFPRSKKVGFATIKSVKQKTGALAMAQTRTGVGLLSSFFNSASKADPLLDTLRRFISRSKPKGTKVVGERLGAGKCCGTLVATHGWYIVFCRTCTATAPEALEFWINIQLHMQLQINTVIQSTNMKLYSSEDYTTVFTIYSTANTYIIYILWLYVDIK